MPKAPAFIPTPALEKLPLAVRRDIRDNFEAGKTDLETQISALLGTPFKININPNEIWAYKSENSSTPAGSILTGYAEGFLSALTSYLDTYGDDGKTHFNDAVTQSELAVAVNPLGDEGETISATVKDGVFVILFHHTRLGYSMGSLGDYLLAAIEAVLRPGFSLVAKHSIDEDYNAEIDELTQEIGNILNMPDVVLDPNFEENYAALAKAKKDDASWQEAFGKAIFTYFRSVNDMVASKIHDTLPPYSTGLRDQLTNQGFEGDEMMQEGFAEVVTSKTFRVRVVKATANDFKMNETILEDGVIYLQVRVTRW
ncbi:hypothetical protein BD779DRAFT_1440000 [Infundibulicybe gibba]|nr:hypothetical protein BD779DRAFT_1440000 [Infundibulicybe gibba]